MQFFSFPASRQTASQAFLLLGLTCLYSCAASEAEPVKKAEAGNRRPVPVVTVPAEQKTVPIQVQGTGTVIPYSTVNVKSLVEGQLTAVYFKEGQEVKQGDLLFKIDARSLQAALDQAEANRTKAIAAVTQAKANYSKAVSAVTQAQANQAQAQSAVSQAKANQAKAQSAVTQAKANQAKAVASVNQAKANQAKDAAQAQNASERAQRYSTLYNEGAISKDEVDQLRTTATAETATVAASRSGVENAVAAVQAAAADVETAQSQVKAADAEVETARSQVQAAAAAVETARSQVQAAAADVENAQAQVKAAEADIDKAKIQLSYSSIFSPIDGRTGSLKVNQGNLVKANDTNPLIVISQIRPIYVSFSVPQKILPEVKQAMNAGPLEVEVQVPNSTVPPARGELTFVDSTVDTTTGTLQLKGSFPNSEGQLAPGEFVNVVLTLRKEPNAVVVPTVAVQAGQKGPFVYVVKSDRTVEVRPVKVGIASGSETAIAQGLKPGEQVVTDGQFNLVPNAKVEIRKPADNKKQRTK
ncbi:MAG: efflux RND transporter periplasmic adaptor subunit [Actinomycetota bacterium]